ncbi:hypothetical protein C8Q73DRAFT_180953 [Cubamyces lactineus]|nr:hypothetical protein C8Q73DRAFT_180953 [Cubamyces lactineus]
MSDLGFNVWGAVAAVVGTAALIPVIHAWFNTHLPRALLPTLSSILQETQESFVTGLREGLFTDDTELYHFHNRIRAIKRQVGEARAEALEATSWRQDVRNWYTGLSSKISHLCRNIDDIRAKLARTQSNKRKLLEAQGYPDTLMISPYAQELLREYTQGTLLPCSSLFIPLAYS